MARFRIRHVRPFQRPGLDRLVADVQVEEALTPVGPAREIVVEGDARELAFQVDRIGLAPDRIVQGGIDIGEDRVLADAGLRAEVLLSLPVRTRNLSVSP